MSISFSGLGSGMDYSTWVTQLTALKEQSIVTPLETKKTNLQSKNSAISSLKTYYMTLATSMQKISDSKYGASFDIFASSKVTMDNDNAKNFIDVSASNSVPKMDFEIEVLELATSSNIKGNVKIEPEQMYVKSNTSLTQLENFKAGTLVFKMNDKDETEYSIDVEKSDTMQSLIDKINNLKDAKLEATLDEDGNFLVKSTDENRKIMSIDGTSNFKKVAELKMTSNGFESDGPIKAGTKSAFNVRLVDSGIFSEGEFKINGETFNIDSTTTMNQLLNQINSNTKANVKALYNSVTGTFSLTSTESGATNIEVEEVSSNFVSTVGLDNSDNITTGTDARFKINGEELTSSSNTVKAEDSGIYGLTLTLKKVTNNASDTSENAINGPIKVSVAQDKEKITSAVKDIVNAINDVISQTDLQTKTDGKLAYDSSLISVRNSIRNMASVSYNDIPTYKTLRQIGISTGAVGTSVSSDTTKLKFDEDEFSKALEKNPSEVQSLLQNFVEQMETQVKKVNDTTEGYFAIKTKSIDKQISTLNDKIDRKKLSLKAYEENLTKRFTNMDLMISQMKNQYTDAGLYSSSS
ncbi:MAG: flagellar filament capping protein FliD [Candidatus Gastranaerophilales bacterium]|nr:flagellar filament capping protein FliD [Candidatus Gastranaerophilales bacterium]